MLRAGGIRGSSVCCTVIVVAQLYVEFIANSNHLLGWLGYDGCSSTAIYIRAVTVSLCACMCVYAWVCLFVCVRCKLIRANVYICRRIYECIRVAHVWPFHLIYYDKASYTQLHRNPHLPSLTSYIALLSPAIDVLTDRPPLSPYLLIHVCRRAVLIGAYVVGIILFFVLLYPATEPSLYSSLLWDRCGT